MHIFGATGFDFTIFCRCDKELIQIVPYLEFELDLSALPFTHTLEMATLSALHAAAHCSIRAAPHLEAASLSMPDIVALVTLEDAFRPTLTRLVANRIALEAQFLIAFE